jgi:hypothetical protein
VVAKRKEGQSYREIARDRGAALLALAHRRNILYLCKRDGRSLIGRRWIALNLNKRSVRSRRVSFFASCNPCGRVCNTLLGHVDYIHTNRGYKLCSGIENRQCAPNLLSFPQTMRSWPVTRSFLFWQIKSENKILKAAQVLL